MAQQYADSPPKTTNTAVPGLKFHLLTVASTSRSMVLTLLKKWPENLSSLADEASCLSKRWIDCRTNGSQEDCDAHNRERTAFRGGTTDHERRHAPPAASRSYICTGKHLCTTMKFVPNSPQKNPSTSGATRGGWCKYQLPKRHHYNRCDWKNDTPAKRCA